MDYIGYAIFIKKSILVGDKCLLIDLEKENGWIN